ncbi:MAG: ribosome recycling factor [Alphaproteobacteria bacterium]|nr:MAG: ribosome recycling factor [Alphaproteobacteria bacterium]
MLEDLKEKSKKDMDKVVESLSNTYKGVRTGRASTNLLDNIKAEVYGALTPLQQLGQITTPEPRIISIQVYDKSAVKPIEKAIRESSLGLNPMIDGNFLRITMPDLTKERREELVKHIAKLTEESRVAVRNMRRDALDSSKKLTVSDDEKERFKKDIQKITDGYIEKIDTLFEKKKSEIMQV